VDDNSARSIEVKVLLVAAGFKESQVNTCTSISSAIKHFIQNRVDLLLTDISIPQIEGDQPLANGGQELLRQLDELKPEVSEARWTLAITAYENSEKLTSIDFRHRLVSVLNTATGSNDWKAQISTFASRILTSDDFEKNRKNVDICLITALRTPELEGVLKLPIKWGLRSVSRFFANQYSGTLEVENNSLTVEAFTYDKMGLVAMSYLTSSILSEFRPKVMILTGICAGISDSVRLGDIVVAESSWNWQAGKQREGDDFKFDSDALTASASLLANARHQSDSEDLRVRLMKIGQHINSQKNIVPAIHFGPMASGSVVVADSSLKANITAQNRKVLALDMEAYAFYASQRFSHVDGTKFLTIKSVCDRADSSKADEIQILCSLRSAIFAEMVIRKTFSSN